MASKKYMEARDNLVKAIDLANQVLLEYPLGRDKMNYVYDGVSYTLIEWFIKCNNHTKELVLNAEKKFQTLQSLKYDIEDFFIYFQEAAGPDVDEFWRRIKEANLPYVRENKLEKIMKRGRIRNDIEYDYVIDTIVPFQQEGILSEEDVKKLNEMIEKFENKRR